jgi:TolA-binding protein
MRNIAVNTNLKKTVPVIFFNIPMSRLSLSLGMAMGLIITTTISSHAAIPVESRPLTSASSATGATDNSQSSQLWQLNQQIQKLQNEVRELRGKVETHDNDIDQLQKEAKNHYTDFDQRIAQSQDDIKKLQASQAPAPTSGTPPADGTPVTAAPAVGTAPAATGDEADKVAYIAAYDAYKAGGAAKAIAPMKQFITDYPNSPFVPNAYYWLGEFNLAITPPNFAAASSNFKIVSNQFPKSAKAAAATYRLATLADVDQHQSTAITLMKTILKNYPGTQEAGYATDYLKSHASTEEKKVTPKKTEKVKTDEAVNQKAKPAVKKKVKAKDDEDPSA